MKKRKAPILLLSLLVILIGSVVVFGMSMNKDQKSNDPDQLTESHDAPSASEVKDQIAKSADPKGEKAITPMDVPRKMLEQEDKAKGPSINVPRHEMTYPKPVPNDQSTSSQWYRSH